MKEHHYKLLRIFINEKDRYEKHSLSDWIINKALEDDIASATVFRGLEGFGGGRKIHTSRILALSIDLPLAVEIIDSEEKIIKLLKDIEPAISHGVSTIEDVVVKFYGKRKEEIN
ncbi:MAG: DUF190 domain-containing protein [bacterium]|nr:DUF190 domain-containing protein [bacterium]